MQLTLQLPDELAAHLGGEAVHGELEKRALEAFALEDLREGRITEVQLCKMLGLARIQMDSFLKLMASTRNTRWRTSSRNARHSKNWASNLCGL